MIELLPTKWMYSHKWMGTCNVSKLLYNICTNGKKKTTTAHGQRNREFKKYVIVSASYRSNTTLDKISKLKNLLMLYDCCKRIKCNYFQSKNLQYKLVRSISRVETGESFLHCQLCFSRHRKQCGLMAATYQSPGQKRHPETASLYLSCAHA